MKNTLSAKKWIASFLALSVLLLVLLAGFAYVVDPYFQYRVRDNTYFLSAPYVNAGLVKNYDYDTLIVGSCMIGNFDMDQFRNTLHVKPLKVESGGMGPDAIATYLNYAAGIGKASQYYVNIDLATFQADDTPVVNAYLMESDPLSTGKYLLGYETWFRFIPVDCGLMLYKAWRGDFPAGKLAQRTSIDQNGEWNLGDRFGIDVVIDNRLANRNEVSAVNLNHLYERMIAQIDSFISRIDFNAGKFTFIFPPYSTLYWCDTQDLGYFDTFLAAKHYFVQELLDRSCTVYDFQSASLANDLNYYKDSTHYCAAVNDWMAECFVSGDYLVTQENYAQLQEQLIENTKAFRDTHGDLFH